MASGTITGSTGNEYIDSKIEWSSTANTSSNTSTVTATLLYKRNNTGYTTYGTGSFSITIDGSKTSASKTLTITEYGWVIAMTASKTITHSSDGTKSITISATGSISGTSLNSTSCSGTAKLDTIPRASTITSVNNVKIATEYCTVKWTPMSKSFRYKVKFSLGSWSYTTGVIHPNSTSAYSYTRVMPYDVANQIPNSKTGTMTATLYTYSDSAATKQIGSASSKTFTVTVPSNEDTLPTVKMDLSPFSSLADTFDGVYIQGKTKVDADWSGSSAKYGASISYYSMTVSGLGTYGSSTSYQSGLLPTAGTITVKGTAKDSRGYSASTTQKITVISYAKPSLIPYTGEKSIICKRCDSEGNLTSSGTYLRIKVGRKYSTVTTANGVQKNFCAVMYRYKKEAATSYSQWVDIIDPESTSDYADVIIPNVVSSTTTSYIVELCIEDSIGEHVRTSFTIPTDQVALHLKEGGNGAAFGKYAEADKCLEIADDWDVTGRVYGLGKAKAEILSGADLNNYKDFGVYAVVTNAIAATLSNLPTELAGTLVVSSINGTGLLSGKATYILQEYTTYTGRYRYRRMMSCNASNEWTYNAWVTEGDSGWIDLGLSSSVSSDASNCGRNGAGCYYKVVNGNHVYVAFDCAFTFSNSSIQVNANMIPEGYRPARNVYAMCATGGRAIARVFVTSAGMVGIDWIQVLSSAETTTSSTVKWIDGYIDYWV